MSVPFFHKVSRINIKVVLFSAILVAIGLYSLPILASADSIPQQKVHPIIAQAKILSAQGEYEKAFALLKDMPKDQITYAAMISNLASIDLDEAEETADNAISDFPADANLHFLRGVIMGNQAQSSIFSALGYAEKSLNSFKKATELAPENIQYHKALMSFYLAAPSIAGGDEALGLKQVQTIQKLDALEGASSQIAFYQMTDEPEKALTALAQAIADYPTEISFVFRLASYHAQQEHYDKAMPLFQQAAKMPEPAFIIDPVTGDTDAHYARNVSARLNALYQIGRTAVVTKKDTAAGLAAMGELQAAVETSKLDTDKLPNMEWAKARIAELYIQSGDKEAASALLANISSEGNRDLKKQVKNLQKSCRC